VPEWTTYLALLAAGLFAGTLNVIAGGGSFLTLPLLIFFGLPAAVANGTNRLGVLAQNTSAVWRFHAHEALDWRWGIWTSVPALLGAGAGAMAAIHTPEVAFRRILATVMLIVAAWTVFAAPAAVQARTAPARTPALWVGFLATGFYGGYLQAGVGFLILALTTRAGLDLVRGNAVKVLTVLLLTLLAFGLFVLHGDVHWPMAVALGAGNFAGGYLGVRLALTRGHEWLRRVVLVTTVVFAIALWLT
jgi:uncharacterized membrane protein YfcA